MDSQGSGGESHIEVRQVGFPEASVLSLWAAGFSVSSRGLCMPVSWSRRRTLIVLD